eukprot:jgi/Tetstr1/431402/TSEL_021092.t1
MAAPAVPPNGSAPEPYLPESFRRLQEVEQKIVGSIEIVAQTMEELSRMGSAGKEKTAGLCQQYLENIRDIKVALNEAILTIPDGIPNKCSDYVSKFAAITAATQVDVTLQHLEAIEAVIATRAVGGSGPEAMEEG